MYKRQHQASLPITIRGGKAVSYTHLDVYKRQVQIARADGRHEPDASGPDYPTLFNELDGLGYDGFVGCEYRPEAGTLEGLGWFAPWRKPLLSLIHI